MSHSHLAHLEPYMAALPPSSKPESETMMITCPTLLSLAMVRSCESLVYLRHRLYSAAEQ